MRRKLYRIELRDARASDVNPYEKYAADLAGFAADILKVTLTPQQIEIGRLLLEPPYRVLVPSANNQGKTFLAAVVTIWWFLTRRPVKILTTAPTLEQVKNLLWAEIRRLASAADLELYLLPEACQMRRGPADFALGTTARKEGGYKGKHGPNQLFIFDEATDVESQFWAATETMFQPPGHAWLAIFNPTDHSSRAYKEYTRAYRRGVKLWHVVRLDALGHSNIIIELENYEREARGEPPVPIPVLDAVRLDSLERRIPSLCQLVAGDPKATDVQWPPAWATAYLSRTKQQPRWWRPGPEAEATILGRFPSQSVYSVWSDGDWLSACREMAGMGPLPIPLGTLPEIGCDVARFGDDWTAFHVRCGPVSLHHESFNGQDTVATERRLRDLAKEYALWANDRRPDWVDEFAIPIKIDDSGVGGGVTDTLRADGYNVAGINAGTKATATEDYPLRRDELWFEVAERARRGELDLSRLPEEVRDRLQTQAMAPKYKLDGGGRRKVDPKDVTKLETGGSPDDMDAVNLAYCFADGTEPGEAPSVGMLKGKRANPVAEAVRRMRG
jgi:hypothetical protein